MIPSLLQNAVRDRLLEFRRDVRSTKGLNQGSHRIHQMIYEMFDPPSAPREMKLQAGTHHSPTKTRPVTHRIVSVGDAQHTLLEQVHDLPVQRSLKPIGDVPGKLLVQQDGFLADRGIKLNRALNYFGRCLRPADDFNQWDNVWWIERMANENTLGVLAIRLHHAWRYSR